ncbi:hypothetical protein V8G54_008970, partial [Vigna mungo]
MLKSIIRLSHNTQPLQQASVCGDIVFQTIQPHPTHHHLCLIHFSAQAKTFNQGIVGHNIRRTPSFRHLLQTLHRLFEFTSLRIPINQSGETHHIRLTTLTLQQSVKNPPRTLHVTLLTKPVDQSVVSNNVAFAAHFVEHLARTLDHPHFAKPTNHCGVSVN